MAAATHPQIHISRANPRGHVIQNGACREKLPSAKRKEYARVAATDATAKAASATYSKRVQVGHDFGLPISAKPKSATNTTADSFEISASAKQIRLRASHRRPRIQSKKANPPKKNCSNSLIAENHITASWCPS